MQKIVLLSCGKAKQKIRTRAINMYIGNYFQKVSRYAKSLQPDLLFILSAKYGLLRSNQVISPYNITLNNFTLSQIKNWSNLVINDLKKVSNIDSDKFIILAGVNYRKFLIPHLKNHEIPFKNIPMGKQLKIIKKKGIR